jgi:uncharacterized protein
VIRALLDGNVLVSALLSRTGAPARLIERWLAGDFEIVVSERLLTEAADVLARANLRKSVAREDAAAFVDLLRDLGELARDPAGPPPIHSPDADDDYLLALAAAEHVPLVSGDSHLLGLAHRAPVLTPRKFLDELDPST